MAEALPRPGHFEVLDLGARQSGVYKAQDVLNHRTRRRPARSLVRRQARMYRVRVWRGEARSHLPSICSA